ncbi:MAG: glycogen synthase, partial [Bacteroidales bacterium]|nr:glycogen synthase [Bacteroidales bacterium]
MVKTKVLYVNQEVFPYLESDLANVGRFLPQYIQEHG